MEQTNLLERYLYEDLDGDSLTDGYSEDSLRQFFQNDYTKDVGKRFQVKSKERIVFSKPDIRWKILFAIAEILFQIDLIKSTIKSPELIVESNESLEIQEKYVEGGSTAADYLHKLESIGIAKLENGKWTVDKVIPLSALNKKIDAPYSKIKYHLTHILSEHTVNIAKNVPNREERTLSIKFAIIKFIQGKENSQNCIRVTEPGKRFLLRLFLKGSPYRRLFLLIDECDMALDRINSMKKERKTLYGAIQRYLDLCNTTEERISKLILNKLGQIGVEWVMPELTSNGQKRLAFNEWIDGKFSQATDPKAKKFILELKNHKELLSRYFRAKDAWIEILEEEKKLEKDLSNLESFFKEESESLVRLTNPRILTTIINSTASIEERRKNIETIGDGFTELQGKFKTWERNLFKLQESADAFIIEYERK